jgi:glycosyltransferase involved in cell wall biosynthesis
MPYKLLIVGDSPTCETGFAKVIRNLAQRWLGNPFSQIDIWGINYNGWPHEYPYNIYPAGYADWATDARLVQLLNLIGASDYTHLFILCDLYNLSRGRLPELLRQICDQKKVSVTHYYPVDAPLEKEWLSLVKVCDYAVTYTEYGKTETVKADPHIKPMVIPHGVDTAIFYPKEERESIRERLFKGWVKRNDFLMVNVNRNEKRKAPQHSLQILGELLALDIPAKLLLHMPRMAAANEFTDLEWIGNQLGLKCGEHWNHNDSVFANGNPRVTEEGLNDLYNAADLVLSTSYGEGFGLAQVEGAAAGCQIASPCHTACREVLDTMGALSDPTQFILLPVAASATCHMLDMSRLRYPVHIWESAMAIAGGKRDKRFILSDSAKEWLSWDRIASEFIKIML